MKLWQVFIAGALIVASFAASADRGRGDDDRGDRYDRQYKQEYWDGYCKVKREFKKNGDYKEKRTCKQPRYDRYEYEPVYRSGAPAIVIDPVIRIDGWWD